MSSTDAAGGSLPYLIILACVNIITLLIANWQAYQARHVNVEFQESKYIALATASMLQAFVIGFPVVALLREDPQAIYIVFSLLIFITCAAILLLLFVPKIVYLRTYDSEQESKKRSNESVVSGVSAASQTNRLKFNILQVKSARRSTGGELDESDEAGGASKDQGVSADEDGDQRRRSSIVWEDEAEEEGKQSN